MSKKRSPLTFKQKIALVRVAGNSEPVRILALDLGTKTGWAVYLANATGIISGADDFTPNRRMDSPAIRYSRFVTFLDQVWQESAGELKSIFFESVSFLPRSSGFVSVQTYGGFLAILQVWADGKGVVYEGISPGKIKKFATGKGNAKKEAVAAAVVAAGFPTESFDEADALALLLRQTSGRTSIMDTREADFQSQIDDQNSLGT